jgi:uncharacterized membrane protein
MSFAAPAIVSPAAAPVEFVLYPNPALPRAGFVVLMAAVALVSAGVGAGFALAGAWPVTGFLGLDVVALFLAFRWARRQGRRSEVIRVAPGALTVRRVAADGTAQEMSFEAYWAQVRVEEPRGRLLIGSHGRFAEIGRFLTRPEKRQLADALAVALAGIR